MKYALILILLVASILPAQAQWSIDNYTHSNNDAQIHLKYQGYNIHARLGQFRNISVEQSQQRFESDLQNSIRLGKAKRFQSFQENLPGEFHAYILQADNGTFWAHLIRFSSLSGGTSIYQFSVQVDELSGPINWNEFVQFVQLNFNSATDLLHKKNLQGTAVPTRNNPTSNKRK